MKIVTENKNKNSLFWYRTL